MKKRLLTTALTLIALITISTTIIFGGPPSNGTPPIELKPTSAPIIVLPEITE